MKLSFRGYFMIDLIYYYFTSINQYSFIGLIVLFLASFFFKSREIPFVIIFRVFLILAVIFFYFVGWTIIEEGGYERTLGRKIPPNTPLFKICTMKKVNDLLGATIYNHEVAIKYECSLERVNDTYFSYQEIQELLTKHNILKSISTDNSFRVIGSVKISSRGLLNPNNYTLLLIQDSKSNVYVASESVLSKYEQ